LKAIRTKDFYNSVEILFYIAQLFLTTERRVTPSLPQKGRQSKGNTPLTPDLLSTV
jgi:hypothetical protein